MSEPASLKIHGLVIDLCRETDFMLGRLLVRPSACEIVDTNSIVSLEPRVMQVLAALVQAEGQVVTRDQLIERCWDGRVVGDAAITRCVGALRKLAAACDNAFAIETLSKVGYRLVLQEPERGERQRDVPLAKGAEGAQSLVGYESLGDTTNPVFPLQLPRRPAMSTGPEKPSIGVLPFLNLSGDPEQEYFADGVTEDIITALSRFHELLTAPRSSTFAFKGRVIDVTEIVRRLGVQYLLTGSVRKASKRIRITAELVHCKSGAQVWRERYDRGLSDIFELQDELSRSVAAVVLPALQHAEVERVRRKAPGDLTAYDLYLRALPHMWAGTKDEIPKAITLLRQSLQHESANVTALCALSWALILSAPLGAASPGKMLKEAFQHACKAIDLDEEDAFAQAVYSMALTQVSAEHDQAVLHAEESVRLNPASTFSWGTLGAVSHFAGHFERALESLNLAVRLSLSDNFLYMWLTLVTAADFALERYDEGIVVARQAIQRNPNFGTAHRLLAANLALAQRIDEAREVTRKRDVVQQTSLQELRALGLFRQEAVIERYIGAQRLCGMND
jgi:TolB-like protein/DNA-binding winged helix-turn-helix (wHTH) protein